MDDVIKQLKEMIATTSTEILKKYYRDMLLGVVPKEFKKYSEMIDTNEIIKLIEEELILRGIFKKSKKIPIE